MTSRKELAQIWSDIEPAITKYNPKISVTDVEFCHTCVLGPYILATIRKSQIFFLIDYSSKNIEIKHHVNPHMAAMEHAIMIRVLMMNRVFPIHTKANKISKSD